MLEMYYNLGLIGFPLSHTLSPVIHNYFIYNNNLNGGYNCFELNDEKKLGDLIKFLINYKFSGLNITLPSKEEIKKYIN
jgi:shikimate dehydrogenase